MPKRRRGLQIFAQIDLFILTHLEFLHLAYLSIDDTNKKKFSSDADEKRTYARFKRSFKFVGNRHEVLHGLSIDHRSGPIDSRIAINVLTLYAAAAMICSYLEALIAEHNASRLSLFNIKHADIAALRKQLAKMFRDFGRLLARPNP